MTGSVDLGAMRWQGGRWQQLVRPASLGAGAGAWSSWSTAPTQARRASASSTSAAAAIAAAESRSPTDPARGAVAHGPHGAAPRFTPSPDADLTHNRGVTPELTATLANLPDRPGVYLMKDAQGRGPVRGQGPEPAQPRPQLLAEAVVRSARRATTSIREAIDRVADIEVTEVDSVSEALLLEANLIKRFKPRFNVRLKDDKSYPYIKITLADDFPRVERTRKLPKDGSRATSGRTRRRARSTRR